MKHIFVLLGTRPEAIKLFPVIHRLKSDEGFKVTVCATAQHRQMLDQVLQITGISPDKDLNLMRHGQTLDDLSARSLVAIGEALDVCKPDRIVVQGDTTTAMIGALAGFYRRIPVAHVEAGLRSGDMLAPWPEEANRKIISVLADQHFAPTPTAVERLKAENVQTDRIYLTGNTVVDALLAIRARIAADHTLATRWDELRERQRNRRIILVTAHRRENHGEPLERIADALIEILKRADVLVVLPLHPNPAVTATFSRRLGSHPDVIIVPPVDYIEFVTLLSMAHIVLTDSGGIQEEAPSFGVPVLVLRDNTERPEAVEAGTAKLVGTERERIVCETTRLLDDGECYRRMSRAHNPFGDGRASERIAEAMRHG